MEPARVFGSSKYVDAAHCWVIVCGVAHTILWLLTLRLDLLTLPFSGFWKREQNNWLVRVTIRFRSKITWLWVVLGSSLTPERCKITIKLHINTIFTASCGKSESWDPSIAKKVPPIHDAEDKGLSRFTLVSNHSKEGMRAKIFYTALDLLTHLKSTVSSSVYCLILYLLPQ